MTAVGDARKRHTAAVTADPLYAVEVGWDLTAPPGLPSLIGPFQSVSEAEDFIRTSVPNGVATVRELVYPFLRSNR